MENPPDAAGKALAFRAQLARHLDADLRQGRGLSVLNQVIVWVTLGSRLIDIQSQNRTIAASATAERNTFGHLS